MGCICSTPTVDHDGAGALPEGVSFLDAKSKTDVRAACDLLVRSFAGSASADPELSFDWVLNGYNDDLKENWEDARRHKYLHWMLSFVVYNALLSGSKGMVLIHRSKSGNVDGIMCLKRHRTSPPKEAPWIMTKVLCRLGLPWGAMSFVESKRMVAFHIATEKLHKAHVSKIAHVYIWAIGVCASAQKQGIGRKLLSFASSVASADRVPIYLEATGERNRGIYEKFGFGVVGEEELRTRGKNPEVSEHKYYAMMKPA